MTTNRIPRIVTAAIAATALLVAGSTGAGAVRAAARQARPHFLLSDTGAHGSEVNLGVTSKGTIFFGGWDHIARSDDDGRTWQAEELKNVGAGGVAADRVLIVDRTTDRIYVDDTTLGCTILSWSDDLGKTWTTNPLACGGGVTDHEKIAVGKRTTLTDPTGAQYPNIVYVCANGLAESPCAASTDGGLTFGPGIPSGFVDSSDQTVTTTCAFQGVPVAGPDGTLYQPKTNCGPVLEVSPDNGLTWQTFPVGGEGASATPDVPDLAVTPDGTLYYLWTQADWRPYLTRSTDGGRTWSPAIPVAPRGVHSAVFPVIAAGGDGKIGLAYYGSTDWHGNPGKAAATSRWYLYAATVTDAASAHPHVDPIRITPQAIARGCISKLGGCTTFTIADYMDAEITPAGRLAVAYVNACAESHACTGQNGFVAVQDRGPLLK